LLGSAGTSVFGELAFMVNLRLRRAGLPAVVTVVAAAVAVTGAVWLGGNADADTTAKPNLAAAAAKAASSVSAASRTERASISARGLRSSAVAAATDETNFGDLNGDGKADLAAVDASGALYVYPGKAYVYPGTGTRSKAVFGTRFKVGTGWGKFTSIIRHGDFNGDGKQDVLTRSTNGDLSFYAGTATAPGIVKNGTAAGTRWNTFTSITGAGDLNSDGKDDLLAQATTGDLFLYTGTGNPSVPFSAHGTKVGTGWKGDLLTAVGDITGDGRSEFLFRNTKGAVSLYFSKSGLNPIGTRNDYIPDGSFGKTLKNIVGAGNIESDQGETPTPDHLWQDKAGFLYIIAIDTEPTADDDTVLGSGWASYRLF
jgi:FG-GAP-like repeat